MIIAKTPFRISFFGGGTDYPAWYFENRGSVISASINKFSYITCRTLPPFFDYNYRIRYYKREETKSVNDIKHPSVRECIKYLKIKMPLDIVHHADLPARSGLGSSSTFTVGLLHALYALNNEMPSKRKLALDAINIEQNILKENVGAQDQTIAAYGGFNMINFGGPNLIDVRQLIVEPKKLKKLNESCLLIFTGFQRTASNLAKSQINLIPKKSNELLEMLSLVDEGYKILSNKNKGIRDFGLLLDEQWKLKKSMSNKITNKNIDEIYSTAKKNGAIGGKLLGAGGGGFLLLVVPKINQPKIIKKLSNYLHVPFQFDFDGSKIIYHNSLGY